MTHDVRLATQHGLFVSFSGGREQKEELAQHFDQMAKKIWRACLAQGVDDLKSEQVSGWKYISHDVILVRFPNSVITQGKVKYEVTGAIALCFSGYSDKIWIKVVPRSNVRQNGSDKNSETSQSICKDALDRIQVLLTHEGFEFTVKFLFETTVLGTNDEELEPPLWQLLRGNKKLSTLDKTRDKILDYLAVIDPKLRNGNEKKEWLGFRLSSLNINEEVPVRPALFVARNSSESLSLDGITYDHRNPGLFASIGIRTAGEYLGSRY